MSKKKPDLLRLLECLAASSEPLSFSQIRLTTEITQATLTRLLSKLCESDYVRKVAHGSYEAGTALLSLSTLVTENAAAFPFRPLLHIMSAETGYNAELYSLETRGPVFLMKSQGKTHFHLNIPTGMLVDKIFTHPAGLFFFHRYPEAFEWRSFQLRKQNIDVESFKEKVAKAVKDKFAMDRGVTRPEIARACVPTGDLLFCICLSGFVSDFPEDQEDKLRRNMLRILKQFESEQVAMRKSG